MGRVRGLHYTYKGPQAEVGEVAICEVKIRGERFMFISNPARDYLKHHGAVPKAKAKAA